jgi:protein-disulfide isomerase
MRARPFFGALAAVAALALPAFALDAQRRTPAPARDWTQTVARTPEGGFRMGNPNAPVKVIEYLSLACVHCAAFARESHPRLAQAYIRPGRVSIEYRNIVISGPDVAATMLTRCAAPRAYFDMAHELLATREQWLGRMAAVPQAERAEINRLPPMQAVQRVVPLLGLDRVAARHGLTPAAQRACLSSQANFDRIEAMARVAQDQHGVSGTPTFVINGRTVTDTNVWAGIEPLLGGR